MSAPRHGLHSLAVLALAWGCGSDEIPPEVPRLVEVAEAVPGDAVDRLSLLGDVHGEVEVRVYAQLPERVMRVHVTEGQAVREGDPIVTLASDLSASDSAQASAALASAEAQRDQLRQELDRIAPLVESAALPATRGDALRAQLRSADAQVEQVRAARRAAGQRESRTVVRAPRDGVVAMLRVEEGDLAVPQVPLCAVVEMGRVEIRLDVVEPDYVRLDDGMEVLVTPPSLPDIQRTGRIASISPVLDPITRTARVDVVVDNVGLELRPGMIAEVAIELERRSGVLLIPSSAVLMTTRTDTEAEGNVFVVEGDTVHRRTVVLGGRYDERMEIRRGLEAGERVVVMGQHLLRDGAKVRVGEHDEPDGPPRAEVREPAR